MDSCTSYERLSEHRDRSISSLHLKDLLQDADRSKELTFEHDGVYVDFSRQNATAETVKVRFLSFLCRIHDSSCLTCGYVCNRSSSWTLHEREDWNPRSKACFLEVT